MAKGRKPIPASMTDNKKQKKSNKKLQSRKDYEKSLKTTSALRVPKHLSEEAKKEWRRLMKLYRRMDADILSDLDKNALSIYCEAYAIWKRAHDVWVKHQQVVSTNEDAQKIIDKTFKTMEKQSDIMRKFSEQLCLTPVGRARMGINQKKEKSTLEKMMNDEDD